MVVDVEHNIISHKQQLLEQTIGSAYTLLPTFDERPTPKRREILYGCGLGLIIGCHQNTKQLTVNPCACQKFIKSVLAHALEDDSLQAYTALGMMACSIYSDHWLEFLLSDVNQPLHTLCEYILSPTLSGNVSEWLGKKYCFNHGFGKKPEDVLYLDLPTRVRDSALGDPCKLFSTKRFLTSKLALTFGASYRSNLIRETGRAMREWAMVFGVAALTTIVPSIEYVWREKCGHQVYAVIDAGRVKERSKPYICCSLANPGNAVIRYGLSDCRACFTHFIITYTWANCCDSGKTSNAVVMDHLNLTESDACDCAFSSGVFNILKRILRYDNM